jgi:hypothetical protein
MKPTRKTKYQAIILSLCGVICAVVFGRPIIESWRGPIFPANTPVLKLPPVAERQPPTPEQLAAPHLMRAEIECEQAIAEYLDPLNGFFADSKKNTRGFAEEALSWGSKWRLMVDLVPWTSGERHERFIRAKFEEYIFSVPQLQHAVQQVVTGYVARVRSIEGKMLVDLRTDASDFPATFVLARFDDEQLQATFDQAVAVALQATGTSLKGDVATQLASIIAAEVLAPVALRLGVSASIIGAGASAGLPSLGVGMLVGLIVDQIVSWVWDWYADPRGSLAKAMDRKIDVIARLIVDGSGDVQGLRGRLTRFARERADLRRKAILELLRQRGATR